jgi:hypothetical protein
MEVIVDACDEQERAIGWYTYLHDKLAFPSAGGPRPPLVPDDYQQLSPRCPDLRWVSPSPRKAAPILEWERIKAIDPLFRFRRFPNQDEVFNSLHDSQVLGS